MQHVQKWIHGLHLLPHLPSTLFPFQCPFAQKTAPDPPSSSQQKPERHSSTPYPSPIDTTPCIYLNWSLSLPSHSLHPDLTRQDLLPAITTQIFPHSLDAQPHEPTFHTAAQMIFERCQSDVTPFGKTFETFNMAQAQPLCPASLTASPLTPSLCSGQLVWLFQVLKRNTLGALHMQCTVSEMFSSSLPLPSSVALPFVFQVSHQLPHPEGSHASV